MRRSDSESIAFEESDATDAPAPTGGATARPSLDRVFSRLDRFDRATRWVVGLVVAGALVRLVLLGARRSEERV